MIIVRRRWRRRDILARPDRSSRDSDSRFTNFRIWLCALNRSYRCRGAPRRNCECIARGSEVEEIELGQESAGNCDEGLERFVERRRPVEHVKETYRELASLSTEGPSVRDDLHAAILEQLKHFIRGPLI